MAYDGGKVYTEMDVGPLFFTQPNATHDANTRTQPNPPIIHLREMQTPALYNPYFYMSVFWL